MYVLHFLISLVRQGSRIQALQAWGSHKFQNPVHTADIPSTPHSPTCFQLQLFELLDAELETTDCQLYPPSVNYFFATLVLSIDEQLTEYTFWE